MHTNLAIKAAESPEEVRQANDLVAREHASDDPLRKQWVERFHCAYPGYQPEHVRLALWNGEVAGALRINTDTIRIGEARLKAGTLGWLTAAGKFHGKGILPQLLGDALVYLRSRRFHLAMMFGSEQVYQPFGFAPALTEYSITLDTTDALTFHNGHRTRPAKPGDIPALQRLHNDNDNEVSCSIVRSSAHFATNWRQWHGLRVVIDEEGAVVGYFAAAHAGTHLAVEEVGVRGLEECASVVAACAELAAEDFLGRVVFHVPPSHPFARYLSQFDSRHEQRFNGSGGGMMAFIDAGETLESMIPEWEHRLSHSDLRDARSELTLHTGGKVYRLRAHRGAVDIADTGPGENNLNLSSEQLLHLLTGYGYVDNVLQLQGKIVARETRRLLEVLFPKRYPFVWPFDRF